MAADEEEKKSMDDIVGGLEDLRMAERQQTPTEHMDALLYGQAGMVPKSVVYERIGRDGKQLQRVLDDIGRVVRRESSPWLQFVETLKERATDMVGVQYKRKTLEGLCAQNVEIVRGMQQSLGEAQKHSNDALGRVQQYHDSRVMPDFSQAMATVREMDAKMEKLNALYESVNAEIERTPAREKGFTELYLQRTRTERAMRQARSKSVRAMQHIVFRNMERNALHDQEYMAASMVAMTDRVADGVAMVLDHTDNLQSVYALFKEGAATMGTLQQSYLALKSTVQLQSAEIGRYVVATMLDSANGGNTSELPEKAGQAPADYRPVVQGVVQKATTAIEMEARRIMGTPGGH